MTPFDSSERNPESIFDYSPQERETFEIDDSGIIDSISGNRFSPDPKFSLKMEAYLLEFAYSYNKILSLSNSRTRILAHQVESTYIIVNSLHQRFMIADEVGLGKTVEAGLVIKEMIYRNDISRILIIAPASLLIQWQNEMEEKFGERFELIDRKYLEKFRKTTSNVWEKIGKGICSVDFIKNAAFLEDLKNVKWDAVIFDEAHRLRRDSVTTTLAYNAAEIISERTKSMILLTATPFRGKLEELYYLIRLVDKNLLGPFQSYYNEFCMPESDLSKLKEKLSSIMIRRTKKEIGGFTVRHARTIKFDLYPEERDLYDATTKYVAEEFNKAIQSENRAVGFIMTVFQKLLDSSSYALYKALINRRNHLQNLVNKTDEADQIFFDELLKDMDDCDEELSEDSDEKRTARDIMSEIVTLNHIIELAEKIKRNKKGEKLLDMIRSLKKDGYAKFLIFTQFKTTQDYLKSLLCEYSVEVFHGSMNKDEKEAAIDSFKKDTEILICTEAGGEGRNMQFCSILFNYDLPWSPLKIEQRIGRIHRFGQKYDVYIYNFSTKNTVAERVLEVLTHKLSLFEESIGTPDIMLGQIEDELNLASLFMKFVAKRKKREMIKQIDESVERAKKSYEKLSNLTVAHRLDFNYDEYYKVTQKERAFSNRQLESFMLRFSSLCDSSILKKSSGGIYNSRFEGNDIRGTFDSEKALLDSKLNFFAFGHPIIDSSIKKCFDESFSVPLGNRYLKSFKQFKGIAFFFVVSFRSVSEKKELSVIFIEDGNALSALDVDLIEKDILHGLGRDSELPFSYYSKLGDYYETARNKLKSISEDKIWDMKENLDLSVDPELDKIKDSFDKEMRELKEKLSRQEMNMNLMGKDMRSAISRTKNAIKTATLQYEDEVAQCRRYFGIKASAKLIGVCEIRSEEIN